MGAFLSNLFGTLMVGDLEEIIRQFGLALASGDWSKLLLNDALWVTIDTVKSRPHSVKELQGYVLSLLGEESKLTQLMWDLLFPGSTPAQRANVLIILRLECVTCMLRSEVFWVLILERQFVAKISELLQGSNRLAAALSLLADPRVARLFASLAAVPEAIGRLQSDLQVLWQQEHSPLYAFALSVLQLPSTRAVLADPAFLALLQPETFRQLAEVHSRRHLPLHSFLDYFLTEQIVVVCLQLLSAHTVALANVARAAFTELVAPFLSGVTCPAGVLPSTNNTNNNNTATTKVPQEAKAEKQQKHISPFTAQIMNSEQALALLQNLKGRAATPELQARARAISTLTHAQIVWATFVTLYCREASAAAKWKVFFDVELYRSVCAGLRGSSGLSEILELPLVVGVLQTLQVEALDIVCSAANALEGTQRVWQHSSPGCRVRLTQASMLLGFMRDTKDCLLDVHTWLLLGLHVLVHPPSPGLQQLLSSRTFLVSSLSVLRASRRLFHPKASRRDRFVSPSLWPMFSPAIFPSLSAVLSDPTLASIFASREWRLLLEEYVRVFPPADLLSWGGLWCYALRDSSMYDACVVGSSYILPILEAVRCYPAAGRHSLWVNELDASAFMVLLQQLQASQLLLDAAKKLPRLVAFGWAAALAQASGMKVGNKPSSAGSAVRTRVVADIQRTDLLNRRGEVKGLLLELVMLEFELRAARCEEETITTKTTTTTTTTTTTRMVAEKSLVLSREEAKEDTLSSKHTNSLPASSSLDSQSESVRSPSRTEQTPSTASPTTNVTQSHECPTPDKQELQLQQQEQQQQHNDPPLTQEERDRTREAQKCQFILLQFFEMLFAHPVWATLVSSPDFFPLWADPSFRLALQLDSSTGGFPSESMQSNFKDKLVGLSKNIRRHYERARVITSVLMHPRFRALLRSLTNRNITDQLSTMFTAVFAFCHRPEGRLLASFFIEAKGKSSGRSHLFDQPSWLTLEQLLTDPAFWNLVLTPPPTLLLPGPNFFGLPLANLLGPAEKLKGWKSPRASPMGFEPLIERPKGRVGLITRFKEMRTAGLQQEQQEDRATTGDRNLHALQLLFVALTQLLAHLEDSPTAKL